MARAQTTAKQQGEDKSTNINMLDSFLSRAGPDSPKARVQTKPPVKVRDPSDPRFILIPTTVVKPVVVVENKDVGKDREKHNRRRPSNQFSTQNDTVLAEDVDARAEQPWLFQTEAESVQEASGIHEKYRSETPARGASSRSISVAKRKPQPEERAAELQESVEVRENSWNSRGDLPMMNISQIPIKIADETSEFSSKGLRDLPLHSNSGSRVILSGQILKSILGAPSASKIVV